MTGWLERFAARHGGIETEVLGADLWCTAPDGSRAECRCPWGPPPEPTTDAWLVHVTAPRTIGVVLVRRAAHAVGVFEGERLVVHHVETHYVQARTKKGGWSQQRYARRRGNQADHAFESAADDAERLMLPRLADLDAVVVAGDRDAVRKVLARPSLVPLRELLAERALHVPDPRLSVLEDAGREITGVRVLVEDHGGERGVAQPPPA